MTQYTHPDLPGIHGNRAFTLSGIQYPRVWWRTVGEQEIAALGFVEYVPEPQPEPEPQPSAPVLYAAAQLQIIDYDITGIEINSKLGGAFWADTGKYIVFFSESQPDTSYMVMASAGPCNAYVLKGDKTEDMFTITVTNSAGEPTDADAVNLSIVRAM